MYTVNVHFQNSPSSPVRLKKVLPGQTLLEVLLAGDIDVRHDCGGICHCTTCHVYIEKGEAFIEQQEKRERDFLQKVQGRKPSSRLSCQCVLRDGSGEIDVSLSTVP